MNKVLIHIRLNETTVKKLKDYAFKNGLPVNIAADQIIQNYFKDAKEVKAKD